MFRIAVEKEDVPYIKLVAYRDGYGLKFNTEGIDDDGRIVRIAEIDADEEEKEIFLEDIECEKESASYGGIPVYSLNTVADPEKLSRLMRLNGTRAYLMLKKDRKAYENL